MLNITRRNMFKTIFRTGIALAAGGSGLLNLTVENAAAEAIVNQSDILDTAAATPTGQTVVGDGSQFWLRDCEYNNATGCIRSCEEWRACRSFRCHHSRHFDPMST